jgi:hypothetical protein
MDLTTMSRKLRAGVYLCVPEFQADVCLIAANAARYNGADSPYTHMAAALRENAVRLLSALPESELDARGVHALLPEAHAPGDVCTPPVADSDAHGSAQQQSAPPDADLACTLPPALSSPFVTPVPSPARTPDADAAAQHQPRLDHAATVDAAVHVADAAAAAAAAAAADADEALSDSDNGADVWRACTLPAAVLRLPPLPHADAAALRRSDGTAAGASQHSNGAACVDEAYARAAARASIMPLLRDAGFSGAHTSAVDTLAEVVSAHYMRLGAALRRLADEEKHTERDALTPVAALACLQRAGPLACSWQRLAALAKPQQSAAAEDGGSPPSKHARLDVASAVPMLTHSALHADVHTFPRPPLFP